MTKPRLKSAVLFARPDSNYKLLSGLDVYDTKRDALTWIGDLPVITHPPYEQWSRLRRFSRIDPYSKSMAYFALDQVRRNGGVLEHPAFSSLWPEANLPSHGSFDAYSGWTLPIKQYWFGNPTDKSSFLYIVGIHPQEIPTIPYPLGNRSKHTLTPYTADSEDPSLCLALWLRQITFTIFAKREGHESPTPKAEGRVVARQGPKGRVSRALCLLDYIVPTDTTVSD